MPIGPNGEMLPYPDQMGGMPMAPDMAGAPPADPMAMAPTGPSFPSMDPGQLAAVAMQAIAAQAGMDQQQIQMLLAQLAEQFAAQQEQAMQMAPSAIEAIIAQLSAPPPETLDGPGGLQPPVDQGAPMGQPGPEEMMAMQMGALG